MVGAKRRHRHFGVLLQPGDVAQRQPARRVLDGAAFQRGHGRRPVGNETENQAFQIGARRVPVVGVTFEHQLLPALPAFELIRPRSDRMQVVGIGQRIGAFVKMARIDLGGTVGENAVDVGRRLREAQHGDQRRRHIDAHQIVQGRLAARMIDLPDVFDRPGNIGRRQRLAVMPGDIGPEIDCRFMAVGADLCRQGQLWLERAVEAGIEQAVENLDRNDRGAAVDRAGTAQGQRFRVLADDQRLAVGRNLMRTKTATRQQAQKPGGASLFEQ